MKSFVDKVAAITGAGSGIGRALALELAKRGAHLALSDVDERGLAETAELVAVAWPTRKITTAKVDVAQREQVYKWADQVVAEHGRCNLIFNNAGVSVAATAEGIDLADFEWVMSINFWGVIYGTKAFLPHLKASGDGHVINVSSLFGILSFPGQSAYNASKFAVRGFTECLREELDVMKIGVSATCVHPGGIRTNIAKASRAHPSMKSLGLDMDYAAKSFDKMLRLPASEAANIILDAVQKNARRILVGNDARLYDAMQRVLPTGYQWFVGRGLTMAVERGKKRRAGREGKGEAGE